MNDQKTEVENLAQIMCTPEEIALHFRIPVEDLLAQYQDTIDWGHNEGRIKIKIAQFKLANSNYGHQMATKLGEKYLAKQEAQGVTNIEYKGVQNDGQAKEVEEEEEEEIEEVCPYCEDQAVECNIHPPIPNNNMDDQAYDFEAMIPELNTPINSEDILDKDEVDEILDDDANDDWHVNGRSVAKSTKTRKL